MLKILTQSSYIFSNYNIDSPESIEFRRINAKIKNLSSSLPIKNVMITSAVSGEGKSTISTFLAITCSKHYSGNTLLVDCDLRRPRIHKIFETNIKHGLADVLREDVSPFEVIKNTNFEKLKIITSGHLKESPTKLLNFSHIKNIFSLLKANFETIIMDTPPIIPVNDSLILNSVADTTILVIKAGKTHKEVVKRAIELIKDTGYQSIGLLVNNFENVLPYYYNYRYYKYKYCTAN